MHATPGGWEIFGLTVSDLTVVALMLAVFLAAVFVPYPRHPGGSTRREGDG